MNDNKLEMNEIEKRASKIIQDKEGSNFDIKKYYICAGTFAMMMFFLTLVLNDNAQGDTVKKIYFVFFLLVILFIFTFPFIVDKAKRNSLKTDKEYQLAKEIMKKYNKKF